MNSIDHSEHLLNSKSVDKKLLQSIYDFVFGRTEAFEYIYQQTVSSLMAVCRRYASTEDEAKDILQESYIKIYKNLPKFDASQTFDAWTKRIAVNTAIDHYRKNIKLTFSSIDHLESDIEDEVFISNKALEYDIELVIKAISELPDGYRIILNLFVFEQKSHKDIAQLLNITESTSRSQLTKARKFLKAKFEKYES